MLENLMKYRIILASNSPRRRKLLEELGLKVEIKPVETDETYPASISPPEVATFLARRKADAYNGLEESDLLITADTIVAMGTTILGKPGTREEAVNMLRLLSENLHHVTTGVCLRSMKKEVVFEVTTRVYFTALAGNEIDYYVDHYRPYDKAGSYGIQEWIGYIGVDRIDGSFYNVMGLPVNRLYRELKNF